MASASTQKKLSLAPELLADLADNIAATLKEASLDPDRADELALTITEKMAQSWGGQLIYFPKGVQMALRDRDRQIWLAFTGTNHAELAREFGVSKVWVYSIIARMRRELGRDVQPDMFERE